MVIVPRSVIVVVGNVPMSPLSVVGPVLVTPAPARTTKLSAVPRPTDVAAWALLATATSSASPAIGAAARRMRRERCLEFMGRPFECCSCSLRAAGVRVGLAASPACDLRGRVVRRAHERSLHRRQLDGARSNVAGRRAGLRAQLERARSLTALLAVLAAGCDGHTETDTEPPFGQWSCHNCYRISLPL